MQHKTVVEVFDRLRQSTSVEEKCVILTYINGFEGKKLSKSFTKVQYIELCNFLIEIITIADKQYHIEIITKTFKIVLQEFQNHDPGFFELAMRAERKKRLKVLEFFIDIDTILFHILLDLRTVKFIQGVMQDVPSSTIECLMQDTVTVNNKKIRKHVERDELTKHQKFEIQLVTKIIAFLQKIYNHAAHNPTFHINLFHILVLDNIADLAFMGQSVQRGPAIKLLNATVKQNLIPYMQSNHQLAWGQFKTRFEQDYCSRILRLVNAKIPDWSDLWCMGIKSLSSDIEKDKALLNGLLNIMEKAFKSTNMEIRKQAFENWKLVINTFTSDVTKLVTSKRIHLLSTPLIESNTKSEVIAVAKIDVWWYLIVKLQPHTSQMIHQIIQPFLEFCFGPFGDTPLFSKKHNMIPSPGKQFVKTQIASIDALLQMLIVREEDRLLVVPTLVDRLATTLSDSVFRNSYKTIIHSFSEAVLMLADMSEEDIPNRERLNKIFWSNLMHYALQSSPEYKKKVLKEMILAVQELSYHGGSSPIISNFILNFAVPELAEVSDELIYRDDTLIELLLKLLSCPILEGAEESNFDDIKVLIEQAIILGNRVKYHPRTVFFVKSVLSEMEKGSAGNVKPTCIAALWYILAELMTKYMIDGQRINEGNDEERDNTVDSILGLLMFPYKCYFWDELGLSMKVVDYWQTLYRQLNHRITASADKIPYSTMILMIETITDCLLKNEKYCIFIIRCLPLLLQSIDYEHFSLNGRITGIVSLLRDVTTVCFSRNQEVEVEFSLKCIELFLCSIYKLKDAIGILSYLECLAPSFEGMLKQPVTKRVEQKIVNTWECMVMIVQNYTRVLSYKFVSSYYNALLLGLCHENLEIAAEVGAILEIQDEVEGDVRQLLNELEREAQKNIVFGCTATKKRRRR